MKRENGFYWIKQNSNEPWEVAEYVGDGSWWRTSSDDLFDEVFLKEIDERRIINPNE